MRRRGRGLACSAAAGLLLAGAAGCVTETREAPPRISPRESSAPSRPAGVQPEQMMLSAGVPSDSDGNTFPDTVPVVVYLFGDTRRFPLPLQEEGTFEFELIGSRGEPLGRWVFPPDETARGLGGSAAGVCYRFGLRMSPGRDVMPVQTASLRAIFIDAETGRRVGSPAPVTIRVGTGE